MNIEQLDNKPLYMCSFFQKPVGHALFGLQICFSAYFLPFVGC